MIRSRIDTAYANNTLQSLVERNTLLAYCNDGLTNASLRYSEVQCCAEATIMIQTEMLTILEYL